MQLVSHLPGVDPRGTDAGVSRFCSVAERLKSAGERIWPSPYDEMAILALTQGAPHATVDRVLRYRERLRQAKPRPSNEVALSLAAGIELAEDTARAAKEGVGDMAALQAIQSVLDAQQEAMVAVVSASTAAAVSSS